MVLALLATALSAKVVAPHKNEALAPSLQMATPAKISIPAQLEANNPSSQVVEEPPLQKMAVPQEHDTAMARRPSTRSSGRGTAGTHGSRGRGTVTHGRGTAGTHGRGTAGTHGRGTHMGTHGHGTAGTQAHAQPDPATAKLIANLGKQQKQMKQDLEAVRGRIKKMYETNKNEAKALAAAKLELKALKQDGIAKEDLYNESSKMKQNVEALVKWANKEVKSLKDELTPLKAEVEDQELLVYSPMCQNGCDACLKDCADNALQCKFTMCHTCYRQVLDLANGVNPHLEMYDWARGCTCAMRPRVCAHLAPPSGLRVKLLKRKEAFKRRRMKKL